MPHRCQNLSATVSLMPSAPHQILLELVRKFGTNHFDAGSLTRMETRCAPMRVGVQILPHQRYSRRIRKQQRPRNMLHNCPLVASDVHSPAQIQKRLGTRRRQRPFRWASAVRIATFASNVQIAEHAHCELAFVAAGVHSAGQVQCKLPLFAF